MLGTNVRSPLGDGVIVREGSGGWYVQLADGSGETFFTSNRLEIIIDEVDRRNEMLSRLTEEEDD